MMECVEIVIAGYQKKNKVLYNEEEIAKETAQQELLQSLGLDSLLKDTILIFYSIFPQGPFYGDSVTDGSTGGMPVTIKSSNGSAINGTITPVTGGTPVPFSGAGGQYSGHLNPGTYKIFFFI